MTVLEQRGLPTHIVYIGDVIRVCRKLVLVNEIGEKRSNIMNIVMDIQYLCETHVEND